MFAPNCKILVPGEPALRPKAIISLQLVQQCCDSERMRTPAGRAHEFQVHHRNHWDVVASFRAYSKS